MSGMEIFALVCLGFALLSILALVGMVILYACVTVRRWW